MTQADRNAGTARSISSYLDNLIDEATAVSGSAIGWATKINTVLAALKTTAPGWRLYVIAVACGRLAADGSLERVWPTGYLTSARGARARGNYVLTLAEASDKHKNILTAPVGEFADAGRSIDGRMNASYDGAEIRVRKITPRGTLVDVDDRVNFVIFEC